MPQMMCGIYFARDISYHGIFDSKERQYFNGDNSQYPSFRLNLFLEYMYDVQSLKII
jgi:hypothetical protein